MAFSEKIKHFVKETELFIKAGMFDRADYAMKRALVDANTEQRQEAIDSIKEFIHILVIKRGNKGSMLFHQDKLRELPPFLNKNVVDTVGAGDSFNAGFIFKYINHFNIEECQEFGNLTGAVSTTAAGGVQAFEDYKSVKNTAKNKFGVIL